MSARCPGLGLGGLLTLVAVLVLASGCAGRRLNNGTFHSAKGYRVVVPGPDWTLVESSRADLELRRRGGGAGMLVNGTCDDTVARRPSGVLARHLLAGLRNRRIIERSEVSVNGHQGSRTIVEATEETTSRFRIEVLTLTAGRCVYDLVYAAPVDTFEAGRDDFERLTESFVTE